MNLYNKRICVCMTTICTLCTAKVLKMKIGRVIERDHGKVFGYMFCHGNRTMTVTLFHKPENVNKILTVKSQNFFRAIR